MMRNGQEYVNSSLRREKLENFTKENNWKRNG
jgi:antirestriction protein